MRTATFPDPLGDGTIVSVWEGGLQPHMFTAAAATHPTTGEESRGLGVAVSDATAEDAGGSGAATGFGAAATINTPGMYEYSRACVQNAWDPQIYSSAKDHQSTSCFQKLAQSGTNRWAYNRWATFTMAFPQVGSARVTDLTIRSRPWRGQESRVSGLTDWAPRTGTTGCGNATFTVTVGPVGFSAPMYNCTQGFIVYPNASKRSMGVERNNVSGGQGTVDFGMGITATNSRVVPTFADYLWVTTNWRACSFPGCVSGNWSVSRIDDGW